MPTSLTNVKKTTPNIKLDDQIHWWKNTTLFQSLKMANKELSSKFWSWTQVSR